MNRRKRRSDRAGRGALPSPGRPCVARREDHRHFWAAIAAGRSSEDAAVAAGVSPAVGARWFRRAGGMPPSQLAPSAKPLSGRYLSFAEREEIAIWRAQRHGVRQIARRLERAPSTISRELRRNAATRSGGLAYRATTAQWHADRSARRPKSAKLAINEPLRRYVQDRLASMVVAPNGAAVHGPVVSWKGRRHGRRQDRRWATAWSPEQIARRLRLDFLDDETMRISHEAIYQALYVQGRGALRRELTACLRTGRALRVPRARSRGRGKSCIAPEILISQRPAEAADRAVPGHWEGDLILGLGSSAIGTLVERTTRFTILLHLPPMAGHGGGPRTKNGPALTGHGAEAVRDAITRDHHPTRTTATIADVGSGGGDEPARPPADRRRASCLLLRPAQPLAARHEREHQRAAASVLSKGHRPHRAQRRRPCGRGDHPQQQAAKDPGLENTGRGTGPVSPNNSHRPCCDDPLNPPLAAGSM
jgi:transposase, IS30 family